MSEAEKTEIANIVSNWRKSYKADGGVDICIERGLGHQPTESEHNYALCCISYELIVEGVIKQS